MRTFDASGGFLDIDSPQAKEFARFSNVDYYRTTIHSEEYITSRWSKFFTIVDCLEKGINRFQDLIVMRRDS
jgi:hypothetical protein